jgi:hypothetical protein
VKSNKNFKVTLDVGMLLQDHTSLSEAERSLMKQIKPFAKGMEVYKKIFDCSLLTSESLHSRYDLLHKNKKLTPLYNGYSLKKIMLNPQNWGEMWVREAESGSCLPIKGSKEKAQMTVNLLSKDTKIIIPKESMDIMKFQKQERTVKKQI